MRSVRACCYFSNGAIYWNGRAGIMPEPFLQRFALIAVLLTLAMLFMAFGGPLFR